MPQPYLYLLLILLLLTSCGQTQSAQQPGTAAPSGTDGKRLNVVVTTQQLADTVHNIAGDKVKLTSLLGPGIDPHSYVATEGDLRTFQNADLILYNGLLLEAQMTRVLEQIGQTGKIMVIAVGDQLDTAQLLNWEPEAGLPYDPHIWNDVRLWMRVVELTRDTLKAQDPANASIYDANASSYIAQLEELHSYTHTQIQRIPQERRVLVTAHDAFNYYGRAYGLEVEAIQGISTQSEASAADIQALANLVIERKVPAIFVESTISPRTVEAVQAAVRAAGQELSIGGQLFSDAMGAAGTPESSYIGMMRHNVDTIVSSLAQ